LIILAPFIKNVKISPTYGKDAEILEKETIP